MTVPETAMDQDDGLEAGKNQIRLARKAFVMEPVAEPSLVELRPQQAFGQGVLAFDVGHHPGSDFGGDDICHGG